MINIQDNIYINKLNNVYNHILFNYRLQKKRKQQLEQKKKQKKRKLRMM
jgi:hypothetical protein